MTAFCALRTMLAFVAEVDRDVLPEEFKEALDYMLDAVEYRNQMTRAFFSLPEEVQKACDVKRPDGKANLYNLMWSNRGVEDEE